VTSKDDKPVGYAKPPLHSRFKAGQSGNPKGRPQGSLNFQTDLKRALQAPVKVTGGGKLRKVSTQQALLLRLVEKAFKGEQRAIDKCLSLAAAFYVETAETASKQPSADDQAILEHYRQEVLAEANASPPDNGKDEDNP
jgi:hypothetical protein